MKAHKDATMERPDHTRRAFLGRLCASGAALTLPFLAQAACNDGPVDPTERASIDLSTDAGVLNYFYAIAQLQSDFWTRLGVNRFPGITTAESTAFNAMASHATNHRNWLQAFQTSGRITDVLTFNFASVNFAVRASAMTAGLSIEDAASQAYGGGIKYLSSSANILLASKMASVAARHSATIRDFIDISAGGTSRASFAGDDIVGPTGVEIVKTPDEIIATISKFYHTTLTVRNA
jgi:hypothetical protein